MHTCVLYIHVYIDVYICIYILRTSRSVSVELFKLQSDKNASTRDSCSLPLGSTTEELSKKKLLSKSCWLKYLKTAALRNYPVHQGNPPSTLKKVFGSNSEFRVSSFAVWP